MLNFELDSEEREVKIVGQIDKFIVDHISDLIEKSKLNYYGLAGLIEEQGFKKLGNGCNGCVFAINDNLALKIFVGEEVFCKDAQTLEKLNGSPYYPQVYAYNSKFMIMERVNGVTVLEYNHDSIKRTFQISPYFHEVMKKCIEYAADKGLLADDLSQSNVMIRKDTGLPIIVDTGTFKDLDEYSKSNNSPWMIQFRDGRHWNMWDHSCIKSALKWSEAVMRNFCSTLQYNK